MAEEKKPPESGDGDGSPPAGADKPGLVGAAERLGLKVRKRIGDVVAGTLWPNLPQRNIDDLLGDEIAILDATTLKGAFKDEEGARRPYLVIKAADPETSEEFTFLAGGEVIVRKITEARAGNHLPLLAVIENVKGGAYGHYYDIS